MSNKEISPKDTFVNVQEKRVIGTNKRVCDGNELKFQPVSFQRKEILHRSLEDL